MTVTNTRMNANRVPKKYEGQDPSEHSDLFTDEDPKNTIKGLGFKDKETAERSINITAVPAKLMHIRCKQLWLWNKEQDSTITKLQALEQGKISLC